jgi:hypothetical protein
MSDVPVNPAPASAPEPNPTPQVNEVVINQNPINSSNPVGQQAPDRPVGDLPGSTVRPPSRREAIQAAFDRANKTPGASEKTPQRPAPQAAEAKKGHNQPPEDTSEERLDLKKRPNDQPRSERGTFAPRQRDTDAQTAQDAGVRSEARPGQPVRTLPEGTPYREPPPRMADHAKAEWAATPEKVRGEVYRMHQEFDGAYRRYKADHDTMNTIRPFHQMAQEHGTTLDRALTNYVTMENKLRSDVIGGLDVIVNNLNLRTPDGRRLGLRDIAYHVLNQSPEQTKLVQQSNAQTAQSHQIGQLSQMVNTLAQGIQQMQHRERFVQTRSAVDVFADDGNHPRFDELGDLIENELKLGFSLDAAYRRAELLRPGTRAAQTRNPSAQTRNSDRSIHGSPDAGPSNGTQRRQGPPPGRREAISNAIKRVGGQF